MLKEILKFRKEIINKQKHHGFLAIEKASHRLISARGDVSESLFLH